MAPPFTGGPFGVPVGGPVRPDMIQTTKTRPLIDADLPGVLNMIHALAAHHGDKAALSLETRAGTPAVPHVK